MTALLGYLCLLLLSLPVSGAPPRFGQVTGPSANHEAMNPAPTTGTAQPTENAASVSSPPARETAPVSPKTVEKPAASSGWLWFKAKPQPPKETTHKPLGEFQPTRRWHPRPGEILQQSDHRIFSPGYNGTWEVTSSKLECTLQQAIPGYALAQFREGSVQPFEFALTLAAPRTGTGQAQLRIEPPVWIHYRKDIDLGVIELDSDDNTVVAPAEWANRMLMDLQEGMQPTLQYWDGSDLHSEVKVILSMLNFRSGLQQFNACRAQLLRYDFNREKITLLNFNVDSSRLSKAAMQQLDEIAEIALADSEVQSIDIEIYTQAKELVQYNYRLATRRARAVRDYLMKKGIAEERLVIKTHTQKSSKLQQSGVKPDQVQIVLQRGTKKR